MTRVLRVAVWMMWSGMASLAAAVPPHLLELDFTQRQGEIQALHGVNSGPLCYRGTVDLTPYHRELGIPLTRLHDVPWVNAEAVDIHLVFPDFSRDPTKADSYRFALTDDYIHAITNVGSQIVYRLGESIEHTARQYFVHPPPDPEKWVAICLGIIRHYNHGWANGFRHNIRYWEIWNEPDVRPAMWTGSDQEYFRLYEVAAKAIRQSFPEVKVGGPALGGTGKFVGETFQPSAFLTNFLAFCRDRQVALDFFSWHHYTRQAWDLPKRARAVRALLDQYGFTAAESHLNEWNYLPDDDWGPLTKAGQGQRRQVWYARMGGPEGAAFTAAGLILLQGANIDAANYYTGEVQGFGLFDFSGVPKDSFYAFKAFRHLLDTPRRVNVKGEVAEQLAILAGTDAKTNAASVLVSNMQHPAEEFVLSLRGAPWKGTTRFEVWTKGGRTPARPTGAGSGPSGTLAHRMGEGWDDGSFAVDAPSLRFRLAAPGVAFIRFQAAPAPP